MNGKRLFSEKKDNSDDDEDDCVDKNERLQKLNVLDQKRRWLGFDNSHFGITDEMLKESIPENIRKRYIPLPKHNFKSASEVTFHERRLVPQDDDLWKQFGVLPDSIRASSVAKMLHLFDETVKDQLDLSDFMTQSHGHVIQEWVTFITQSKFNKLSIPANQPDAVSSRLMNYGHHHELNGIVSYLIRFPDREVLEIGMCMVDKESLKHIYIEDAITGKRITNLDFIYICSPDAVSRWISKKNNNNNNNNNNKPVIKHAAIEIKAKTNFFPLGPKKDSDELKTGLHFPGLQWMPTKYAKSFSRFKGYYIPQVWSEKMIISQHFPNVRDKTYSVSWCIDEKTKVFGIRYSQRAMNIIFTLLSYIVGEIRKNPNTNAIRVGHFRDPQRFNKSRVQRQPDSFYAPAHLQNLHNELVNLIDSHAGEKSKSYEDVHNNFTSTMEETKVFFGGRIPDRKTFHLPQHPPETPKYVMIHTAARFLPSTVENTIHKTLNSTIPIVTADQIQERKDNVKKWLTGVPELAIFSDYVKLIDNMMLTQEEEFDNFVNVAEKRLDVCEKFLYDNGISLLFKIQDKRHVAIRKYDFVYLNEVEEMMLQEISQFDLFKHCKLFNNNNNNNGNGRGNKYEEIYEIVDRFLSSKKKKVTNKKGKVVEEVKVYSHVSITFNLFEKEQGERRIAITYYDFRQRIVNNLYNEKDFVRLFYVLLLMTSEPKNELNGSSSSTSITAAAEVEDLDDDKDSVISDFFANV